MDGKVCIFIYDMEAGGAEKTTADLANGLVQQGIQVVFLVRRWKGIYAKAVRPDIPVIDMKVDGKSKLVKNLVTLVYLRGILKDPSYDALLCVTIQMGQIAALSSLFLSRRVPIVTILHSTVSREKNSFQFLRRKLLPFFDRRWEEVVAVSETVARDYGEQSGIRTDHVRTIYNPIVSASLFDAMKKKSGHPWLDKPRYWKTLVLAGRLAAEKNHTMMFRALRILQESGDYRLILLGTGELEEELKKQAEKLGIKNKIDFYGYAANPYSFFYEADAVVLCSLYEGLPTVLVEALACGATVISTDCPSGPAEILMNGAYGVLVPQGDAEALALGILEGTRRKADLQKQKRRAMDFSVQKSVEQYLDMIAQLKK